MTCRGKGKKIHNVIDSVTLGNFKHYNEEYILNTFNVNDHLILNIHLFLFFIVKNSNSTFTMLLNDCLLIQWMY